MTHGEGSKNKDIKSDHISPSSPLYLHPNENPSLTLTPKKINGENYVLWVDAVKTVLDAKDKLAFIEGKIKSPVTPKGQEESLEVVAWRQYNAMLKSWIRCSIQEELHASINFSGTVTELWKELRERYATGNAPRVHQLKGELNDCKQKKDQSVVQYYTNLKMIWDELSSHSKVPQCTCGAVTEILKEREEKKSICSGFKGERHKAVTKGKEEALEVEAAMASKVTEMQVQGHGRSSRVTSYRNEQDIFYCGHCGKAWHNEDNCWSKPGNFGRGRGRGRRGRGRGGRGNEQRANAAGVTEGEGNGAGNLTADELVYLHTLLAKIEGDNKTAMFVNDMFCKNPMEATPEDFFSKGLDIPGKTNNLGVNVTQVTATQVPGLNTLGISLARIDLAPYGINPPHTHPRATEVLTVIDGTLYVGFVTSNLPTGGNKLFTKVLNKGDVFVFPQGLVHFQFNVGNTPAVAFAGLSSQNPGVLTIANAVFGSQPPISVDVLAKAFQLDANVVKFLQCRFGMSS
ncbi:hypothetical protein KSS87_012257 [Heliosperma pusillum]|nr:hypothetical protein KSS87_012257 [Heliosperma pusillum]